MMKQFVIVVCVLFFPFGTALAQPHFKGGANDLNSFLKQNLIYPEYSKQNCISGTIQVSFGLDKAGKVRHAQVYKGMGIDLDDEAVRVIRLTSGKWAVPSDIDTNTNIVIPITFSAIDTRCHEGNVDPAAAIEAYKNRTSLVDAVTYYYSNKYLGKADTSKEPQIIALKEQLGFDDDFADDMVKQGQSKLKQGDKDSACEDWLFVRNTGSNKADALLARYCGK